MTYMLSFFISVVAGWSVAACDALFRAQERPALFSGTSGTIFLLVISSIGGLLVAGGIVWALRIIPSSAVLIVIALGGYLGASASNFFNVTAAGAANRMIIGLAGLIALCAIAWSLYPV